MKSIVLIASASALALGLAACGEKPVARATLDCPSSQGDLTLKTKAADGKTCVYAAGESEVTLQLVAGEANATLDRLEAELLANRAKAKADIAADEASSGAAKADAKAEAAEAKADAAQAEAEAKAAKAEVDADAADSNVRVHISGDNNIQVNDEEGTARVNLPGIHIEADDKNDSARVQVGPIKINANGDEATVRIRKDQRMRGEAFSTKKRGIRATFISKVKNAPDGFRYVGYEAAGPKSGPIVVGVVKSKSGDGGEDLHDDVMKLVRRNGGV